MAPPAEIKLYHITHVSNLASIVRDGGLWSDSAMTARRGPSAVVGMATIKQRRLQLPVTCHPGDCVGDYVPFYFCARSVMLYVIHRGNHPSLTYRGGQDEIVHLMADMQRVVDWADRDNRRWAFTSSNAGASYCQFYNQIRDLSAIDWSAVQSRDWQSATVREAKQAEFLLHDTFPWTLVERVGVRSRRIMALVDNVLRSAPHVPKVEIKPNWYY